MKLYLALSTACAVAASTTKQGSIYLLGKSTEHAPSIPTISTSGARLFLAQRLGLSEFHSLSDADEPTLELLNSASSEQKALFVQRENPDFRKSLFLIEGADAGDLFSEASDDMINVAHVSDIPTHQSSKNFIKSILGNDRERRGYQKSCTKGGKYIMPSFYFEGATLGNDGSDLCNKQNKAQNEKEEALENALRKSFGQTFHSDMLDVIHIQVLPGKSNEKAAATAKSLIQAAITRHADGREVTIVTFPANNNAQANEQGWSVSSLPKRQITEEVLSSSESGSSSNLEKPSPNAPGVLASKVPVSATQPRCAESEDECNSNTNSCSGHGKCKLTDKTTKCWSCTCSSTREKGVTTYWGGPACQKRDISVPFWLFAGFSIAMTAAVTWGIGLLYSMGESQLPSVLSAGVPPTARK